MLSPAETELLQAIVNRISPADDYPAGWDAGVGDYLLQQFTRDLHPFRQTYQQGLAGIEAETLAVYQTGFRALEPAQQDTLLNAVEHNQVSTQWATDPAAFFTLLVDHCMEGFYSDPQNGGNRDAIAWDMIGFEVRG